MNIRKQPKEQNFPGFQAKLEKGQFWKYPEIMDHWWCSLSGSEQKVLDYILRRTYGFQRTEDKISLSQIKKGIRKKTGEQLDKGAGLKQDSTILKALRSLENKGFVEMVKRQNKTTLYRLKLLYKTQESVL